MPTREEIRAAAEQDATRKCRKRHAIVGANAYRRPSTGQLDCQLCRLTRLDQRTERPRPSQRAARAPLSPALVYELRSAVGLEHSTPRTPQNGMPRHEVSH